MRLVALFFLSFAALVSKAQDCSGLAQRQAQLEANYEALQDSIEAETDKKVKRQMKARLADIEWEYGDVSFQLNQCVQTGGVIGDVVAPEVRVELTDEGKAVQQAIRTHRPLNGMERGLVQRSKGTIKLVIGGALMIPLVLVAPELAIAGGLVSIWGMGEIVSGSIEIIDAAEGGQIQE